MRCFDPREEHQSVLDGFGSQGERQGRGFNPSQALDIYLGILAATEPTVVRGAEGTCGPTPHPIPSSRSRHGPAVRHRWHGHLTTGRRSPQWSVGSRCIGPGLL